MAKTVITHPQEYWRTIAILAGGNFDEMIWDSIELEVPNINQTNLDIVIANFDSFTPVPTSWPTNPDLTALSAVSTLYWKVDTGNIVEMIQTEKDTIDSSILATEKDKLIIEIDAEATDRIHNGPGFEWLPASGQFFSLSSNAQIKWVGLMVGKDFLTFPLAVPSKDDDIFYDIQDATEAQNMYLTAMSTVGAYIADCTTTKKNVRAATTITGAQATADVYLNQ